MEMSDISSSHTPLREDVDRIAQLSKWINYDFKAL